tara:strand:+ start:2638 stop:3105 length:468 start_codon:yes stop_codon:yes gene_type:complete
MLGKLLLVSLSLSSALTVKEQVAAPALRLRGGSALTPAAAGALYHGFFGAGLYISPDMFGDKSVLSYAKDVEGPVGGFFGRGFGSMLLGAGLAYLVEPEATVLTPLYAIMMTLFTPILAKNIKDGDEGGFKRKMWIPQAFVHIPFTVFMLLKAFK